MRIFSHRFWMVLLTGIALTSGHTYADDSGSVTALQNELKSLRSDLADLKGQLHSFQKSSAALAPAYVAPASPEGGQGLLKVAEDINMGGYVAVQWNQNFNDGFKKNPSNTLRGYDNRKDSLTVNQALLWFEKPVLDPGQAGFRMDLLMGEDARTLGSDGYTGDAFDLMQAYVEYKACLGFWDSSEILPHWIDFKAGRFTTLAGIEVPQAPNNWEVSRGLLYLYAVPTTHTGIRANFKLWKDFFDVYFGINNGWDQAVDANAEKTLEFGLGYEPVKNVKFLHSVYLGQETGGGATNDLASNRFVTSNVVTWSATEKLSLAGELDYGTSRGAIKFDEAEYRDGNWFGLGAHAKYQWTERFAPFYRTEWVTDQGKTRLTDGTTGFTDNIWANTFGAEYKLTENLITRGEYRMDKSVGNEAYDGKFSQQQTLEGQVIYLIG